MSVNRAVVGVFKKFLTSLILFSRGKISKTKKKNKYICNFLKLNNGSAWELT